MSFFKAVVRPHETPGFSCICLNTGSGLPFVIDLVILVQLWLRSLLFSSLDNFPVDHCPYFLGSRRLIVEGGVICALLLSEYCRNEIQWGVLVSVRWSIASRLFDNLDSFHGGRGRVSQLLKLWRMQFLSLILYASWLMELNLHLIFKFPKNLKILIAFSWNHLGHVSAIHASLRLRAIQRATQLLIILCSGCSRTWVWTYIQWLKEVPLGLWLIRYYSCLNSLFSCLVIERWDW